MKRHPHNRDAEVAIIRARTALYIDEPFYGILALRLEIIQDPNIKTLSVSPRTIRYNPDFFLSLDEKLQMSAIAHEVQHCMLDHMNRRGPRNPRKWSAATDYVINANLKRDGFDIGTDWLYQKAFDGPSADHIYALLPDAPDGPVKGPGEGPSPLDELVPSDVDQATEDSTDWNISVVQAAAEAKRQGKLPASIERAVEEIKGNKVPWRERLRRFAMAHTKNDFSWSHPQRRMVPFGYYLPSLHTESLDLLVDVIDTSGSIDQYTLDVFGGEVSAAKAMARPLRLMNIYCDAQVNRVDEFGEHELPTFKMCGGGGTDFRPPFTHIEENNLKPACLIYLTDGEGTFPRTPPPYPVLWVMTTDIVAPFGETVQIDV
jgi:predicted metal-dependent peptidase